VHSAMPSITAKRKVPRSDRRQAAVRYKAISVQIREIFAEYTPIIEPLSLDEAYLDVTENRKGIPSATQIAEEIRARLRAEIELTASYNKFLAKLGPDYRTPDGLFVIPPKMGQSCRDAARQEVSRHRPATARKMAFGMETGLDLKGQTEGFLQHHFGRAAKNFSV
jgi:DNA polymerase IV